MLLNIVLALSLIFLTIPIHATGMALSVRLIRSRNWKVEQARHSRIVCVASVVIFMFLASVFEILIWAFAYQLINAIQDFEQATYFSMVTFTTLGYGDIVLTDRWRLLASFEAANGIIIFGWTTALVNRTIQHVYFE
ncbi:MAG: potassium channel family protein [Gammaproteobacteria bacterium]